MVLFILCLFLSKSKLVEQKSVSGAKKEKKKRESSNPWHQHVTMKSISLMDQMRLTFSMGNSIIISNIQGLQKKCYLLFSKVIEIKIAIVLFISLS